MRSTPSSAGITSGRNRPWVSDSTPTRAALLAGRTVFDRLLAGGIHFLHRDQRRGRDPYRACRRDGEAERRGGGVVGQVRDQEGVVLAEGVVERLDFAADALDRHLDRLLARGGAFLAQAL